ncbi:MAG: thioredoxin-related protein [Flavobacteriales bacterium]|jgi:thioredoxin-related protein
MKYLFILALAVFSSSCHQKLIKELQEKSYLKNEVEKPTLVMIGSPKCGFCNLAKKTINTYVGHENVSLLFVEFEESKIDTLPNGLLVGANNLDDFNYKFFPQFILLEPHSNKLKHVKGWDRKRKSVIVDFLERKD